MCTENTENIFSVITINLFLVFSARNQFLSPLQGSPGALPFQGFASLIPGYFLTAPSGTGSTRSNRTNCCPKISQPDLNRPPGNGPVGASPGFAGSSVSSVIKIE